MITVSMYMHIIVLVAASAFPVVQIFKLRKVDEFKYEVSDEISDASTNHPDIEAITTNDENDYVHGLILDDSDFNPRRSQAILESRINRKRLREPKVSLNHELKSFVNFQIDVGTSSVTLVQDTDDDDIDANTDPQTECQRVIGYEHEWLTSVRSCSPAWTGYDIRRLCRTNRLQTNFRNGYDLDLLPVQAENGIMYHNRYCAMCNYAQKPKYWEIYFECEQPTNLFFQKGGLTMNVLGEYGNQSACELKVLPPYDTKMEPCKIRSRRNKARGWSRIKPPETEIYPISFSILMNFGFDGKTHVMFSTSEQEVDVSNTKSNCGEGQIMDPENKVCRKVRCSTGYSLKEEICVRNGSVVIYKDSDIDQIKNVDTLTNHNRVAKIYLEVNVTNDELGLALFALEFKPQMIQKLAALLNITPDRIQNFSIAFLNQSQSSGHNVRVETMPKEEFEKKNQQDESDDDILWESILGSPDDLNETKPATNTKHDIRNPQILQLAFILLPSRAQNASESVSKIIQKMNALLRDQTFKFEMNGTTFNIVDVDDTIPQDTGFCKFGFKNMYFDNSFDMVKIQDPRNASPIAKVYVPSTKSYYGPGEYEVTVLMKGRLGLNSNLTDLHGYLFVCNNPRIVNRNCARIKLGPDEYLLHKNKSISFNGQAYNMTQYSVLNDIPGELEICVPDEYYNNNDQRRQHRLIQECHEGFERLIKAEGYITAIIGRLSIIALCSVFVTYCLFRTLRNLPGINTMNLTLALLIAETMFIEGEGTESSWVCSFVAISVHYFFLASFFWMNVMSYDVYKTFANKCILTRIRSTRKFIHRYALYAWGSPLVIISVCALIEYGGLFENIQIGYGHSDNLLFLNETENVSDGYFSEINSSNINLSSVVKHRHSLGCWIQNPIAALVAFGAPVMVIFVINTVFFVRTIMCIQATAKLAQSKTRRTFSHMTGKNDVMLYVRMSTVMGFTWIFGLTSSLISALSTQPTDVMCLSLHILSILFTLFNCAQGLFIFFAFVFKRRVLYLFKGLYKKISLYKERRKASTIYKTTASAQSIATMTSQVSD